MKFGWIIRLIIVSAIVLPFLHLSRCEFLSGFAYPDPLPWECVVGRKSPPDLFSFRDDPLTIPAQIMPEWYFAPSFSILRSVSISLFGLSTKTLSIALMWAAFLPPFLFAFVSWKRFPIWGHIGLGLLVANLIALGALAYQPFSDAVGMASSILMMAYFLGALALFTALSIRGRNAAVQHSDTFT